MQDQLTQPELIFFNEIKNIVNIIFDVGSSTESIYLESTSEVHYFEPYKPYLFELQKKFNKNNKSYFNNYGLSDENSLKYFSSLSNSFIKSFTDKVLLNNPNSNIEETECLLKRGDQYMIDNKIEHIDLLKIDVECMESYTFRGFGDKLNNVKIIQFEYGPGQKEVGDTIYSMTEYLINYGFSNFFYMYPNESRLIPITDYNDNWIWCNIVSYNSKYFSENPFKKLC